MINMTREYNKTICKRFAHNSHAANYLSVVSKEKTMFHASNGLKLMDPEEIEEDEIEETEDFEDDFEEDNDFWDDSEFDDDEESEEDELPDEEEDI